MGAPEYLKRHTGHWFASPRRVVVDVLFLGFSLTLFYTGFFEMTCEVTEPGYLYYSAVRFLYFMLGIFCALFLTNAFIEGQLKPVLGRLGVEPMRKQTSLTDLDIDQSNYAIQETQEELKLTPTQNETTEFNPERNE